MALRVADPRFTVKEFGDGQPFIFVEHRQGEYLEIFKNNTDFRLVEGTTMDQARELVELMNRRISRVAEHSDLFDDEDQEEL